MKRKKNCKLILFRGNNEGIKILIKYSIIYILNEQ